MTAPMKVDDDFRLENVLDRLEAQFRTYKEGIPGLESIMKANHLKLKTMLAFFNVLLTEDRKVDPDLLSALVYLKEGGNGNPQYQALLRLKRFLVTHGVNLEDPRAIDTIPEYLERIKVLDIAYERNYAAKTENTSYGTTSAKPS